METAILEKLKAIVGEKYLFVDEESRKDYGHDETERLSFPPEAVVKPANTEEISAIMHLCNEAKIPVTPRAGGTGLSGGALPIKGGILLSIERLNKIIDIDEANLQATVEPGVITEVFQDAVKEMGLFYPPDPSSKGSCCIAGNIAENSGGPKAVKYGKVKDYVLNLEVVLPTGDVIWTGANVLKNSTGYNLTQLMIGSEGTLGIVTKAVFKLLPYPKYEMLMLVPFHSLEGASAAVSAIFRGGYSPSSLELVEIDALKIVADFVDSHIVPITDDTAAHLIIEVDGNDTEQMMKELEGISILLEPFDIGEIYFAEDEAQKNELWKLRRRTAEAVKALGYSVEEDTVVPRAELPKLIKGVKALGEKYDFKVVCYGHAGDGNIHCRINKKGSPNSYGNNEMHEILEHLYKLVFSLGGTISGEHGIGLTQKSFLPIVFSEIQIALLKGIKATFDPNNILNPGKIFDIK